MLSPPASCCGRTFHEARALLAHTSSHRSCELCDFNACSAALKRHRWEAHAIGTPPVVEGRGESAVGRSGAQFRVFNQSDDSPPPLEARFPGAQIVWAKESIRSQPTCNSEPNGAGAAALPTGARLVLLIGETGSGKTRLLSQLAAGTDVARSLEQEEWPANHSILDALGAEAHSWLAAVGLGSVPLWQLVPYPWRPILTLASVTPDLHPAVQRASAEGRGLCVDNFCDHLDPLSAACCAASLARHLRKEGTTALLASCHAVRAHPYQMKRASSVASLFLLSLARDSVWRIGFVRMCSSFAAKGRVPSHCDWNTQLCQFRTLPLQNIRRCGLPLKAEHSFGWNPIFRHDAAEPPPMGGVVLACKTEETAATRSVYTFFDKWHDGISARRLPNFPSTDEATAS
ncbi:MAG: hypothetical protein SGPRY_008320 [Prymnesium sp.]